MPDTRNERAVEALKKGGERVKTFEKALTDLLNFYSEENDSNTPDFILAQYLLACLAAWNVGVQQRENWYGRDPRPTCATNVDAIQPERGE